MDRIDRIFEPQIKADKKQIKAEKAKQERSQG